MPFKSDEARRKWENFYRKQQRSLPDRLGWLTEELKNLPAGELTVRLPPLKLRGTVTVKKIPMGVRMLPKFKICDNGEKKEWHHE